MRPHAELWELRRSAFGTPPGVFTQAVPTTDIVATRTVFTSSMPPSDLIPFTRIHQTQQTDEVLCQSLEVVCPTSSSSNDLYSIVDFSAGTPSPSSTSLQVADQADDHHLRLLSRLLSNPVSVAAIPAEDAALDEVKAIVPEKVIPPMVFPAQVIRGRVTLPIDDDDIDDLFNTAIAEPVFSTTTTRTLAKLLSPKPSPKLMAASAPNLQALAAMGHAASEPARTRNKPLLNKSLKMQRIVVDIEDFGVIGEPESYNGRQSRPSSADPPLVELRRRSVLNTAQDQSSDRCSLQKGTPAPCGVAGRFSECALCPRAHELGVRVKSHNTFLTFETDADEAEAQGSRRRSMSE